MCSIVKCVNISLVRVVATNPENLKKVQESLKGRPGVKILVVGEPGGEDVTTHSYHQMSSTPGGSNLPALADPDNMFLLPFSSGR